MRRVRPAEGAGLGAPQSRQEALRLPAAALRQLNRLQLSASRYLPGEAAGQRASLRRRPAYDFREHRAYVPGDDLRFVDWKASARQEHVFVRQGEYPKQATVYLLLDGSRSMVWGEPPKYLAALQLAAALGLAALSQSDRLVVQPLGAPEGRPLGPISGKGQMATLLNYLRGLTFDGQAELGQAVRDFSRRRRGGLVLLLSDLLELGDLAAVLDLLPAPRWDVVLLHLLHSHELAPELRGDYEMVDIENGRAANYDVDEGALKQYQSHLDAWRAGLELTCVEHGAFYSLIPTGWSLAEEILPHLRELHILTPL
ncbi:MAG: DUF58 domain-containing protein [Candidatus Promineifilaceae bacterium]